MSEHSPPLPGDPVPWFSQRSVSNPRYTFDTAAGRYLVLCFFHSAALPAAQNALAAARLCPQFDDSFACFFGVSTDPEDEGRLANRIPGIRHFLDFDLAVSTRYGAAAGEKRTNFWLIIDPTMRVIDTVPFAEGGSDASQVLARMAALPPPYAYAGRSLQAPILYLPRVFEPALCRHLIEVYDAQGGELSGFMRHIDGKTVGLHDTAHKVRRDVMVTDGDLMATLQNRVVRRILPEIAKVHQFHATRMERYLVACYDAAEGGHFAAHRDNTTPGTAHRRFAVSINLNDEFEGGEVSFPEYGPQGFKAEAGGAVVFSCSLLHAVGRVTSGTRYAFLPFLYDDAAAKIRNANRGTIAVEAQAEVKALPFA